jgi:endonuclease IV
MKIGFSTSWIDCDIERLEAVAPMIDALEIGTRGDTGFFHSLEQWVKQHEMPVQSVHASAGQHKTHSEPYYTPNIVSPDPMLRQKDMDEIAFSAEWAEKLGARALILHLGKVENENLKQEFLRYKQIFLNRMRRHAYPRRE